LRTSVAIRLVIFALFIHVVIILHTLIFVIHHFIFVSVLLCSKCSLLLWDATCFEILVFFPQLFHPRKAHGLTALKASGEGLKAVEAVGGGRHDEE
jgi:hypothetical protein